MCRFARGEERRRRRHPCLHPTLDVASDAVTHRVRASVGHEALDVQAQALGACPQVPVLKPALVGEQRVVHLPERVLTRRRLGRRLPGRDSQAPPWPRHRSGRLSPEVSRSPGSRCERRTPSTPAIRPSAVEPASSPAVVVATPSKHSQASENPAGCRARRAARSHSGLSLGRLSEIAPPWSNTGSLTWGPSGLPAPRAAARRGVWRSPRRSRFSPRPWRARLR